MGRLKFRVGDIVEPDICPTRYLRHAVGYGVVLEFKSNYYYNKGCYSVFWLYLKNDRGVYCHGFKGHTETRKLKHFIMWRRHGRT